MFNSVHDYMVTPCCWSGEGGGGGILLISHHFQIFLLLHGCLHVQILQRAVQNIAGSTQLLCQLISLVFNML